MAFGSPGQVGKQVLLELWWSGGGSCSPAIDRQQVLWSPTTKQCSRNIDSALNPILIQPWIQSDDLFCHHLCIWSFTKRLICIFLTIYYMTDNGSRGCHYTDDTGPIHLELHWFSFSCTQSVPGFSWFLQQAYEVDWYDIDMSVLLFCILKRDQIQPLVCTVRWLNPNGIEASAKRCTVSQPHWTLKTEMESKRSKRKHGNTMEWYFIKAWVFNL